MKRGQILILLLMGTLITACAGGLLLTLRAQRTTEIHRIQIQARTDSDIAAIARRVVRIERPTTAELNHAVIVALKACTHSAPCKEAFMAAAPRGRRGSTGARGPTGARGSAGARGRTGRRGAAGPQGATGPRGPQGATGPRGPQGLIGASPTTDSVLSSLCERVPALRPLLCR